MRACTLQPVNLFYKLVLPLMPPSARSCSRSSVTSAESNLNLPCQPSSPSGRRLAIAPGRGPGAGSRSRLMSKYSTRVHRSYGAWGGATYM